MGATLGAAERRALGRSPTANATAYRLYLQGREYHGRAGYVRQNFESARQLYERAVTLDPGFALAYAKLSEVYGLLHWFRYDPEAARVSQQREAAETALRLAPDLPQAHRAMGLAHYWGRGDYHAALEEFTLALDGLPNDAWLVAVTGYVHRRLGNWDAALAAFEEAMHLDRRDATLFLDLGGITRQFVRRYADAMQAYEHALSLAPDYHDADARRAWAHVYWHGRLDSLRAALEHIPPDADLGALGTRATQVVHLLHWEREPDSPIQAVATTRQAVFERHLAFLPASLYTGWARQLSGDNAAAHEAFESAIAVLDSVAEALPDDWRVNAGRGLALAALERRDEALREADRLARSAAYRDDAFFGPLIAEDRAPIFAQAGEPEAALDEIERLMAEPSWLSFHSLRLGPLYDPIRSHASERWSRGTGRKREGDRWSAVPGRVVRSHWPTSMTRWPWTRPSRCRTSASTGCGPDAGNSASCRPRKRHRRSGPPCARRSISMISSPKSITPSPRTPPGPTGTGSPRSRVSGAPSSLTRIMPRHASPTRMDDPAGRRWPEPPGRGERRTATGAARARTLTPCAAQPPDDPIFPGSGEQPGDQSHGPIRSVILLAHGPGRDRPRGALPGVRPSRLDPGQMLSVDVGK